MVSFKSHLLTLQFTVNIQFLYLRKRQSESPIGSQSLESPSESLLCPPWLLLSWTQLEPLAFEAGLFSVLLFVYCFSERSSTSKSLKEISSTSLKLLRLSSDDSSLIFRVSILSTTLSTVSVSLLLLSSGVSWPTELLLEPSSFFCNFSKSWSLVSNTCAAQYSNPSYRYGYHINVGKMRSKFKTKNHATLKPDIKTLYVL